jgi:hypothetical protein
MSAHAFAGVNSSPWKRERGVELALRMFRKDMIYEAVWVSVTIPIIKHILIL